MYLYRKNRIVLRREKAYASEEGTVIRTVLTLKTKPGLVAAVVELFESEGIIDRALSVEGCSSVEVWTGTEEVLVIGTWADDEAYQAWLAHPERNASNGALNELLDAPVSAGRHGNSYALALAGGRIREDRR